MLLILCITNFDNHLQSCIRIEHSMLPAERQRCLCNAWAFAGTDRQMVILPLESPGPVHQVQHGLVGVLTAQDLEAIDDLRLNGACLHSFGVCITRTAVRHHQQPDIIMKTASSIRHRHQSDIIIIIIMKTASSSRHHHQSDIIIIIQTSSSIRHHHQSDIIISHTLSSSFRHHHHHHSDIIIMMTASSIRYHHQ